MVLAEMLAHSDPSLFVGRAIFFLILSDGVLLFLRTLTLADSPVASDPLRRKRFVPRPDLLDAIRQTGAPAACGTQNQCLLIPSRPSEHGGDKRRSLRRDGSPVTVLIADARSPDKPLQGQILDRSRGGLFLTVSQRINAGCLLTVRTPDFPDVVASVQLRVKHCKQKGPEWRIGCQFVDELPWSVLLLFG
jgi:hypothetical protein